MNTAAQHHGRSRALSARIELAMARVLAPLDPARADRHLETALEMAYDLGFGWPQREPLSAFIAGETELLESFQAGQAERVRAAECMQSNIAWLGEWRMTDDGQTERRPVVALEDDGLFYPGYETSWCGGEGPTTLLGEGLRTLEAAIEAAEGAEVLCGFE